MCPGYRQGRYPGAHPRAGTQRYRRSASLSGASSRSGTVGRTADSGRASGRRVASAVLTAGIGTGPAGAMTGMTTVGAPIIGAAAVGALAPGAAAAGVVVSAGRVRHTTAQ